MRISEISPYILGGLVALSWVGIGFYIFPSEEKQRIRAEEFIKKDMNTA